MEARKEKMCNNVSCGKMATQHSSIFGSLCDWHAESFLDSTTDTLPVFNEMVELILRGKAEGKGYAPSGGTGADLLDFVKVHAPGHAEGEMIYKVIRWTKKREPEDLLKIAAWAYLVWEQNRRGK